MAADGHLGMSALSRVTLASTAGFFVQESCSDCPWIMQVKFEVHIFNHVEAIGVFPPKFRGSCVPSYALFSENF